MRQQITSKHKVDENGLPAGGSTTGRGFRIDWQAGPIQLPERLEDALLTDEQCTGVNGAFVEGLIQAVIDRINWYQTTSDGKFKCRENALAITKLEEALHWLDHRALARAERGVLSTHKA